MSTPLIAIDAGHGTQGDPGAVGPSGLQEAEVTGQLGIYLENELKLAGLQVFRTDRSLLSSSRAQAAGQAGCSLLVSLYCNAAGSDAQGLETWYRQYSRESRKLAGSIQYRLAAATGAANRGVKDDATWHPAGMEDWTGGMGVLRESPGAACLVELLFISNPVEEKKLSDPGFLLLAARAIGLGIQDYLQTFPPPALLPFPDLPLEMWQGKARSMVLALAELGIVSGYEDGTFRPQQPVTRLEAAALVYKTLVLLGKAPGV